MPAFFIGKTCSSAVGYSPFAYVPKIMRLKTSLSKSSSFLTSFLKLYRLPVNLKLADLQGLVRHMLHLISAVQFSTLRQVLLGDPVV